MHEDEPTWRRPGCGTFLAALAVFAVSFVLTAAWALASPEPRHHHHGGGGWGGSSGNGAAGAMLLILIVAAVWTYFHERGGKGK